MIYFLQSPDGGPIKIGTSLRLSERLRALGKEKGQPLRVLGVTKGEQKRERELHGRFSRFRIRGEWFQPDPALLRFIEKTARPWDGVDESRGKVTVACVKGSPEWVQWLKEGAAFSGMNLSRFVLVAMVEYAKRHGFDEKPPKRLP